MQAACRPHAALLLPLPLLLRRVRRVRRIVHRVLRRPLVRCRVRCLPPHPTHPTHPSYHPSPLRPPCVPFSSWPSATLPPSTTPASLRHFPLPCSIPALLLPTSILRTSARYSVAALRVIGAAARSWTGQRWRVHRLAVVLAAAQAALVLVALLAALAAIARGAWGGAVAAAVAALFGWLLLAVELAQAAAPLGVACRQVAPPLSNPPLPNPPLSNSNVSPRPRPTPHPHSSSSTTPFKQLALPSLASYPALSLSLTRGALLLLLSALLAAAAAPPRLLLLFLCLPAAAAAYALKQGASTAATLRRLAAALPTRKAALDAFAPREPAELAATLKQLLAAQGEESRGEPQWCDLLVSIDLDRDGRVGAVDVAAWFGEIDQGVRPRA